MGPEVRITKRVTHENYRNAKAVFPGFLEQFKNSNIIDILFQGNLMNMKLPVV